MGWKTNPKNRAYLSPEFTVAVRAAQQSRRTLATVIGVSKKGLDHWLEGINRVDLNDPRVAKLAAEINFPSNKIFEVIGG